MGRVATEEHEGSYTWCQGQLLYKGRVVISNDAPLKSKLLHEMHGTEVGGHSGVLHHSLNWDSSFISLGCIEQCNTMSNGVRFARI